MELSNNLVTFKRVYMGLSQSRGEDQPGRLGTKEKVRALGGRNGFFEII